jgi:hypothetical protein
VKKGVVLEVNNQAFLLEFPEAVWKQYPQSLKKIFADHYAFFKCLHLPQLLRNGAKIEFATSDPLFRDKIFDCFLKTVPFAADMDGVSTQERMRSFLRMEFQFSDYDQKIPDYRHKLEEKAVLSMSFGKDSLLTFALAKELGLNPVAVMNVEDDAPLEAAYKNKLAERFAEEFSCPVERIHNNTTRIHYGDYWQEPYSEWGFAHMMTEYSFNALPFVHYHKARYILVGNEQSCDYFYINPEGYKSYPVYDQTSDWLIELTQMSKMLTHYQTEVSSLIKPLQDMAIIKILHKRYPHIAKYQMSCFPDNSEYGKQNYWCQHCSKCARIYIYLRANDIDPATVGFNIDMLRGECKNLYALFGGSKKDTISFGYDSSGVGRDEQLYAFYLAWKNGVQSDLIKEFAQEFLAEARSREEEFHANFFGIHATDAIPAKLKQPLYDIFRAELAK